MNFLSHRRESKPVSSFDLNFKRFRSLVEESEESIGRKNKAKRREREEP